MRLFPRTNRYFEIFEAAADRMAEVGCQFAAFGADGESVLESAARLLGGQGEREGAVPGVIRELEHAFVTPFDREDILALAYELDDVTDGLVDVADLVVLHRATDPPLQVAELGVGIGDTTDLLNRGVHALRDLRSISFADLSIGVNDRVREGGRLIRRALADLYGFEGDHPARRVLQWKDVLDETSMVLGHLQEAARILETTVVKYS